jgi:hypothetical protein
MFSKLKKQFLNLKCLITGLVLVSFSVFTVNSHAQSKQRKQLDDSSKKQIVSILEANEKLHSSFFNYDGKKIEKDSKFLLDKIMKIENKEISKLLSFSKEKLKAIHSRNDKKVNNQNYHLVSMALIHIVNKFDVGTKYNAYSCPMVKKKWLQNTVTSKKTRNPYAANMPGCGVKDSNY